MNEWIKELKAGDLVFVTNRHGTSLRQVEKITPKGFVKVGNSLFNPETGVERGTDPWCVTHIKQATAEAVESFKRNALISSTLKVMQGLRRSDITYEQAVEIRKILHINGEK